MEPTALAPSGEAMTTPAAFIVPTLQSILQPVSEDIGKIDYTLRSTTNLEYPILQQGVEAIIAAGGKRLRPAVLFLSARLHHYDLDKLLPMAAAIELLHTASLVHDDTIDKALIRRGLPTLNSVVDAGTTVLVGDYLFAKSAVLSTMGGSQRATRIFAESLVTISEGELAQKVATHHVNRSPDQYYSRIYSKTAVLFAAAGEIGAVLSDAPEDEVQCLRHYGRQVGMAFQIVDDILDLQSTTEKLGKPTGGDLRQGTVTLPTMLYLDRADEEGREVVQSVIEGHNRSDRLVEEAINRINSSGAVQEAAQVAQRFVDEAKASLAGFEDTDARQSLVALADFVVRRTF
ncbi:MAG: polyprenyl synthetase family protein [Chloroflexi bacterium]|nr:polyprenyl synthetase family protein [Chloroflexota bacterium]